jgi:serine/threonine protein phosphatase PrpC
MGNCFGSSCCITWLVEALQQANACIAAGVERQDYCAGHAVEEVLNKGIAWVCHIGDSSLVEADL